MRVTWMAAVVTGVALVAGCTSSQGRPAPTRHPVAPSSSALYTFSTCGTPFEFTSSSGKSIHGGACSGAFGPTAHRLVLQVGDPLHLQATSESDGSPDFPIPVPDDRRVIAIVHKTAITADYLARQPGRTALNVTTRLCYLTHHKTTHPQTCPALIVRVKPTRRS